MLAIAFITAAQALDLQRPALQTSPQLEAVIAKYRTVVPMLEGDRWMQPYIDATREFLQQLPELN